MLEASDDGELVVHRLSDGSRKVIAKGPIRRPTGPDREGRIAYMEDGDGRRHSDWLWISDIDSPSPYQPFPHQEGVRHFLIKEIALSPVGGLLALRASRVTNEDPVIWTDDLAVFDLETRGVEVLRMGACENLAWSPDGKRIAFSEPVAPVSSWISAQHERVQVFDLESRRITASWGPAGEINGLWFEPDSPALLAEASSWSEYPEDKHTRYWRLEPGSVTPTAWDPPGLCAVIQLGADGLALGYALPTAGVGQEYWRPPTNAPTAKFAIKLFDRATGASCTVAPRWQSFYGLSAGEVDP